MAFSYQKEVFALAGSIWKGGVHVGFLQVENCLIREVTKLRGKAVRGRSLETKENHRHFMSKLGDALDPC